MKIANRFSKSALIGALFFMTIILSSCQSQKVDVLAQFKHDYKRPWIGPEYWANPMQDWQVNNGRVECFVSGGDRNLFLLSKELDENNAGFTTRVTLGSLSENLSEEEGWLGFKTGIRGNYQDYRDNAVRGRGLPIGITTKGQLFIGQFDEDAEVLDIDWSNITLDLSTTPNESETIVLLKVLDASGKEIGQKTTTVAADWLIGGIALACSAGSVPNTPETRPVLKYGNWGFRVGTKRQGDVRAWFSDWTLSGAQVVDYPDRKFGPILFAQYTMSSGTVNLTAQMAPVGDDDDQEVFLDLKQEGKWIETAVSNIDALSRTACFELDNWLSDKNTPYRVRYSCYTSEKNKEEYLFEGNIRKEPWGKNELVVAGFTGNNDLGFPNSDIYNSVAKQNPDFLFFSGDQIYEGVGGYGTQSKPIEAACLDYLRKWYLYGWAYGDILKDRPSVAITDDHDVYHGNIWGAGGIATPKGLGGAAAQDQGGYKMNPVWVNMVQRTQTSHLPEPYDDTPVAQNIGVYYTSINYAGVSFAVLEDRKFKSAPATLSPEAKIVNGWAKSPGWNAATQGDVSGAILLGDRQINFLEDWASDWTDSIWMKVVLSQTIFANVATLPEEDSHTDANVPRLRILEAGEYPPNDVPVQDYDSNGWPQTPRNTALETMRKGYAFHIAGDQHLGSVIEYGIDDYHDAGFAFCVPAISNVWPRRWFPQEEGLDRKPNNPMYTGDFLDGFGNLMTVHAVSNPVFTGRKPSHLYDRATGFGIVRLQHDSRDIVMECWPRTLETDIENQQQYPGWPIVINQFDNYVTEAKFALPRIKVPDIKDAVIQVIDEDDGDVVYTVRIIGHVFKPPVDKKGTYTFWVGEPGTPRWKAFTGIKSDAWSMTREFIVGFN
ncbi:MAG: alkaline phosphatase D family protein [Bacteroidales bacterium]|nr:alkaline phosphatase D family protein [Bacteroidales bacterium]